jgi:hypothetical protein
MKCSYFTGTAEKLLLIDVTEALLVTLLSKNAVRTSSIQEMRVAKLFIAVF